jgi:flagellar export protein FliJ
MPQFQFRLDRVLDWRRKQCEVEEERLARALASARTVEERIERLRAEQTAVENELLHRSAIAALDLVRLSHYRGRVRKEESELAEELSRRLKLAAEQRARVRQAQQRLRLIEKLRERKLTEYSAMASKELEDAAAEAYLARWPQSRAVN